MSRPRNARLTSRAFSFARTAWKGAFPDSLLHNIAILLVTPTERPASIGSGALPGRARAPRRPGVGCYASLRQLRWCLRNALLSRMTSMLTKSNRIAQSAFPSDLAR